MIIKYFLAAFTTFFDAAEAWQLSTQDLATPIMEGMIFFHNYLMFFIIFIVTAVCWLLYIIIIRFNEVVNVMSQRFNHSSILEIIWTIIPAVIIYLSINITLMEAADPEKNPSSWDDRVIGLLLFTFGTYGLMLLATKGAFPAFLGCSGGKDEGTSSSPQEVVIPEHALESIVTECSKDEGTSSSPKELETQEVVVPEVTDVRKYINGSQEIKLFKHPKISKMLFHEGKVYGRLADDPNSHILLSSADVATLVDEYLITTIGDATGDSNLSTITPTRLWLQLKICRPGAVSEAYDNMEYEEEHPISKDSFLKSIMPYFKGIEKIKEEIESHE